MTKTSTYYDRVKRVGKPYKVNELALQQAFDPKVAYVNLARFYSVLDQLKKLGIEKKLEMEVLDDVYNLLGVHDVRGLWDYSKPISELYKLLNVTEPRALLTRVSELLENQK